MSMHKSGLVAAALTVLLAGCQEGPPPPESAASAAPEQSVESRVEAALRSNGLTVEQTANGLRATSSSDRFARCDAVEVGGGDSSSARQFTPPESVSATALVTFTPSGSGTAATWQTSYSGNYLNRESNESFERPCEGTGALEDLLQKAVDG
ncbi:MAG: hypothetical protein R3D25_10490 [Geminicoccaceae bacterium]